MIIFYSTYDESPLMHKETWWFCRNETIFKGFERLNSLNKFTNQELVQNDNSILIFVAGSKISKQCVFVNLFSSNTKMYLIYLLLTAFSLCK